MKRLLVLAGGILAVSGFMGNTAQAAPCTTEGYSSAYSACSAGNANKASTTVTSSETVAVATSSTAGLISDRLSSINVGGGTQLSQGNTNDFNLGYSLNLDEEGKAAGNGSQKLGVWVNMTGSRFDYDKANSKFDGNLISGMVGADYRLTDKFIAGVGLGYERTDIDTDFNTGTEEAEGFTVAPYAVYLIDNVFSVNASFGYSQLEYDLTRTEQNDRNIVMGNTESDRWFGSLNANGNWAMDNWMLGASLGTMYVEEDKDGFTETGSGALTVGSVKTEIGRASVGANVGYEVSKGVTPYVKTKYSYDYEDGGSDDQNTIDAGLGLRVNKGNISAGIEASGTQKGDYQSLNLSANLRVTF